MGTNSNANNIYAENFKASGNARKRSFAVDLKDYLKSKNTKYKIFFQSKPKDIPTIVVANHFARPPLLRKSFFTTGESVLTSAIIATAIGQFSKRQMTATVKNDLLKNILFLSVKMRKIQLAAIDTYGLIGVGKNYPFSNYEKWQTELEAGKNIIVYPEGEVSQQMKMAKPGFDKIINLLNVKDINYQILPMAIYWQNGMFLLKVGTIVNPNQKHQKPAKIVYLQIASMLPKKLRGHYL